MLRSSTKLINKEIEINAITSEQWIRSFQKPISDSQEDIMEGRYNGKWECSNRER